MGFSKNQTKKPISAAGKKTKNMGGENCTQGMGTSKRMQIMPMARSRSQGCDIDEQDEC